MLESTREDTGAEKPSLEKYVADNPPTIASDANKECVPDFVEGVPPKNLNLCENRVFIVVIYF